MRTNPSLSEGHLRRFALIAYTLAVVSIRWVAGTPRGRVASGLALAFIAGWGLRGASVDALATARAMEMVRLTQAEYRLPDGGTIEPSVERFTPPDVSPFRCEDVPGSIMPDAVRRWCTEIDTASARWGLDPRALAILVSIESAGNPEAVSSAGAVGLTQQMPGTAAGLATQTGLPCADGPRGVNTDPPVNLACGARYLVDGMRAAAAIWHGGSEAQHLGAAGLGYHDGHGVLPRVVSHWQASGDACTTPSVSKYGRDWCRKMVNSWQALPSPVAFAEPIAAAVPESGALALPWPVGEAWRFSGGPHPAWNPDGGGAALDFAPPDSGGCAPSAYWATAIAPGVVVSAAESGTLYWPPDAGPIDTTGTVLIDHGDGLESLYSHMSEAVPVGLRVEAGDRIGRPSCLGGFATGSHVHLAIRRDGQWLADSIELAGWRFISTGGDYMGAATHESLSPRPAGVGAMIQHDSPSPRTEVSR